MGRAVDMNGLVRVTDDGARVLFVGENDYTTNVRVMNVAGTSPTRSTRRALVVPFQPGCRGLCQRSPGKRAKSASAEHSTLP